MTLRSRIEELVERKVRLRWELEKIDAELDTLLPKEPTAKLARAETGAGSYPDRVQAVLDAQKGREFSASDVANVMEEANINLVRSTLSRLAAGRRARKVRHGIYMSAFSEEKRETPGDGSLGL